MKELILTNLSKNKKINKNFIAIGHWVDNEKIKHLSYHWENKTKLNKDYRYLKNLSEELIVFFIKKLNFIHNENKSSKYWRIILSPWLYVYISSMYDRWEIINSLIRNKNNFSCDYFYSEKVFKTLGINSYIKNVTTNDLWNHSNFIRIIKYKKINKIRFKNKNKAFNINISFKKQKNNSFKDFFENIFSYISIFFNSTIIENFYISKKDYLNLCIRSRLFPGLFKNFFTSKILYKNKTNFKLRDQLFKNDSNKKNFKNFIYECLKLDFPLTYLENYKSLKSEINSKGFQNKDIKKVFSMTSFIGNEIFKIWLANKVENGSKFIIASHGGCLTPKLNGFFDYFPKIADRIITIKKSLNNKEIQMPLLKNSISSNENENNNNIYIFDCEPANYPCKIQSWPFINQYQKILKNTDNLINFFSEKDIKNIFYRSLNNGKNLSQKIKKKNPSIKLSDLNREQFKDIKKNIKLAICMYPETVIVDLITNGIPTIIYIPKELYSFDNESKKMIKYLKLNQIYFDDFEKLKSHLNRIKDSPREWWMSKSNQLVIKKFKENFFKVDKNYILKWDQLIKQI